MGPIQAAIFGWIPVLLWVLVGGIFFGGVHDFGSLYASIRHDGKSIGEIIDVNIGKKGKKLFSIFAWLTLLLVVAAFTNIVADTFVVTPAAASASIFFMILAILFGVAVYRMNAPLGISSVVGVVLLFGCIYLGTIFPISLSKGVWIVILLGYIFVASVTPVWVLLQPRDYLNSFLLYAMIIGALLGIFIVNPQIQMEGFIGFNVNGKFLFPFLFVTVACGAISGFHSLVGSGTSSKQLYRESDAKRVGFGAMLIESLLAVVALITVAYLSVENFGQLMSNGGPINVFADGIGNFMVSFGIPYELGKSFTSLAISAFALTSLDTATRLGRFIFQEFFESEGNSKKIVTNKYVSTTITVVLGGMLAVMGYEKIWSIFGAANQLLAAIALLAIASWLSNIGKDNKPFIIPMVFMFAVTLTSLVLEVKNNIGVNYLLVFFAVALFILALILIKESIGVLTKKKQKVN